MKKKLMVLCLALALVLSLGLTGCGSDALELNVYNHGEYIADGSDGLMDVVSEFESWYEETYGEKVKVNYTTFISNEDMYSKLSSGAVSYDVIFPSDYMIARMADEGLLMPLNFDNIPNYEYIPESFHGLYYDPENTYSVPYTFGIVGITYDANTVDAEDIGGWDLLWNEKYAGRILQFNNSRDALATAAYKLGLDVNSEDPAVWDAAADELLKQRPYVYSYVMDEVFNIMEAGEASICAYYNGDYFLMKESQAEHVDLQFYYPESTNYFVDAMCIPNTCQNQELAEIFINFLLNEDVAVANAEYILYSAPHTLVPQNAEYQEYIGAEAMEVLYPEFDDFIENYNKNAYHNLPTETLDYMNTLWESIKIN
ncbi:MAG: spermidine/putrescine ABC transporter substrate-binding protein [Firmicutes bacterium]|nr:spermidine/putrescine ABC transporter substrate-binding protein [Bacillota bacterium]